MAAFAILPFRGPTFTVCATLLVACLQTIMFILVPQINYFCTIMPALWFAGSFGRVYKGELEQTTGDKVAAAVKTLRGKFLSAPLIMSGCAWTHYAQLIAAIKLNQSSLLFRKDHQAEPPSL